MIRQDGIQVMCRMAIFMPSPALGIEILAHNVEIADLA